jgi:RND family efflux transporter MFP subunit
MSALISLNILCPVPLRSVVWRLATLLLMPWAAAQASGLEPVTPVQIKAVGSGFEMDGVVQPVKQSTVSAQTSGHIVALLVKSGDKVRAGQLLATIDDRETQTGMQRSQAQVAQAQADLRNVQANFKRTQELRAQGFVSAAALDTAEAQLKSAMASHDQASAGVKQSNLVQGFTRVTAPFDALILQTHVETGDLAVPGKPLLTLYAPLPLRAVVQVPVSRAKLLSSAVAVDMQVLGTDGAAQWIRPTLVRQLPSADPVSQTIEWRLDVPNQTAQTLTPGQQIRVRFASGQVQRLVIPAAAVLHRGELTAVYAVSDKGFVLKAVRLGADHGSQGVEVLAGLTQADHVALNPVSAGLVGAKAAPVAAQ